MTIDAPDLETAQLMGDALAEELETLFEKAEFASAVTREIEQDLRREVKRGQVLRIARKEPAESEAR